MMKEALLIASGDLRESANRTCQAEQEKMEAKVIRAFAREGVRVRRAHPYDPKKGHGFIDSQAYGMEVFRKIPPRMPLIVAEAVWQYSNHVLPGLATHRGPILTVANWSGTWPGLVGMLNLNASMTTAGVRYSTIWSERFNDPYFTAGIRSFIRTGRIRHDASHVRRFRPPAGQASAVRLGRNFARAFRAKKAILGVFDEGCMGMFNAIIPDSLLNQTGVFKERLSQSTLYAKMRTVSDRDARAVFGWYIRKGLKFRFGTNEASDLTRSQVMDQCRMYVAALRLADEFRCDTVGIQYQQGLKDLAPASDLVEGTLNNTDRPPVRHEKTGRILFPGEALPHFNEVDECAGLDGLITHRLWKKMGYPPETTLHDVRWGRHYRGQGIDDFVWVFLISGGAPPAHFIGGWKGASSERQPGMYFRLGGGTLKGISHPGWIVWSRVFMEGKRLKFDTGLGEVVALPEAETAERWRLTCPQWPIMHAVLKGVTRDQFMGRHQANHIQVAYAPSRVAASRALHAKAAVMDELGLETFLCGDTTG